MHIHLIIILVQVYHIPLAVYITVRLITINSEILPARFLSIGRASQRSREPMGVTICWTELKVECGVFDEFKVAYITRVQIIIRYLRESSKFSRVNVWRTSDVKCIIASYSFAIPAFGPLCDVSAYPKADNNWKIRYYYQ